MKKIHPTAIINPDAQIGDDCLIGPYAVIGEEVEIAEGCVIGAGAHLEFVSLGKNCRVFPSAALGGAPQDLKYAGEKTRLIVGNNCIIREFVTLNRGTKETGQTLIGNNCLFMAYSHVAHDCIVGDNVIMANAATLGGHVEVGEKAVLGGLVAVHQFCRIGKLAMLGGGAMVAQDIPPFTQAQGDRARLIGLNLVGLRRAGFSSALIEEIKSAYRILFNSGLTLQEALDQLSASSPSPEVNLLLDFIRTSRRGISRPRHKDEPFDDE